MMVMGGWWLSFGDSLITGSNDTIHDVDLQGVEIRKDFITLRTGVFRNVHFHSYES